MKKTKEDSEKTRQRIIDAGITIFSENWYESVKMSDIAKKAGITRGAIYWHFKNKMRLFIEIHKLVIEESTEIINKSFEQGETTQEKLFFALKNIMLKFSNDKNLRAMIKVININQSVFNKKEFKDWHNKYKKEKEIVFIELFNKAVGLNIGEFICENTSSVELISIAAYLQGLINVLVYKRETGSSIKKLDGDDISKLINIFLYGLFNNIPNTKPNKNKGELNAH